MDFIPRPGMWFEEPDGKSELIGMVEHTKTTIILRDVQLAERIVIRTKDGRIELTRSIPGCPSKPIVALTIGWGPEVLHTYEVGK